jgi:hypothetical protein
VLAGEYSLAKQLENLGAKLDKGIMRQAANVAILEEDGLGQATEFQKHFGKEFERGLFDDKILDTIANTYVLQYNTFGLRSCLQLGAKPDPKLLNARANHFLLEGWFGVVEDLMSCGAKPDPGLLSEILWHLISTGEPVHKAELVQALIDSNEETEVTSMGLGLR